MGTAAETAAGGQAQEDARAAAEKAFLEGERLRKRGNSESLRQAIEKYNQALPLWVAAKDVTGQATTLNNLGLVYSDLGDKQKALDYYNQALTIDLVLKDRVREATARSNIGSAYGGLGDRQKALEYFNEALLLQRAAKDPDGEATTLHNIGDVYSQLGELQKALDNYDQALPRWVAARDLAGEAMTFTGIGLVYHAWGEMQKALDYYNKALPLETVLGDLGAAVVTLNNIGGVYEDLDETQRALDYYNEALLDATAIGDRAGGAAVLNNMGRLCHASGDPQKALGYYTKALSFEVAIQDRAAQAKIINNIAQVYSDLGEKQKALDYFTQLLPVRHQAGDRAGEAMTLSNIGTLYNDMGDNQKALDYFNRALPLLRAVGDRDMEARIVGTIAGIERAQDKLTEARADIEAALKIVESLRTKVTSQELRASYFATFRHYYESYIEILMRLHSQHPKEGYDALALEASERGQARSLLETVSEAHADIRQGVDPRLLEQEQALQELVDSKSARLTLLMHGPHTAEQAETAHNEIDHLLGQYQDLEAEIRTASPHYAALTQPQPLTAKQIQEQILDPDTVLLEYALGRERSYVWAVTTKSLAAFPLPPREEIESQAKKVSTELAQPGELTAEQFFAVTHDLAQVVLGPVAATLGQKRLLIVPDGALYYVPFGALPEPSTEPGRKPSPLVVHHEIVYLPSASTLAVLRQDYEKRTPAPKLVAVLADPVFESNDERVTQKSPSAPNCGTVGVGSNATNEDSKQMLETEPRFSQLSRATRDSGITGELRRLKCSRVEADSIMELSPSDSRLEMLDFSASKAAATSPRLSQYQIVLFATHGLLDSQHPELSGVVLSTVDERGAPVDGFLRLHDIYNLTLPAELVVLSACQTALGKEVRGEGLVGLTRGFMYAGAPRVVVSLWNVNDLATSELMKRFYQYMRNDKLPPAKALQAAQSSMWNDPIYRSPYYWAAFVLQGEWK